MSNKYHDSDIAQTRILEAATEIGGPFLIEIARWPVSAEMLDRYAKFVPQDLIDALANSEEYKARRTAIRARAPRARVTIAAAIRALGDSK